MNVNIKELLTLPTYILSALAIASGVILFLPEPLINQIYMSDFRDNYGFIIGLTFLVSISILLVSVGIWLFKLGSNRRFRKKFLKNGEKKLCKLNDYEMAIIYTLYSQDNRTFNLPINDGAISGLEYNKMVGKVGSSHMVDMMNPRIPYLLQPWVIEKLDEKPDLLNSFRTAYQKYG